MPNQHSESTRSTERTVTRRWIRADEPIEGWWPWGLVPLLGLALIALVAFLYYAPQRVEEDVEQTALSNLKAANYHWAEVAADGQELLIRGTPPSPVSEVLLASLARGTDCDTWAGNLGCPTVVRIDLGEPAAQPALKLAKPTAIAPPAVPSGRAHNFEFIARGDEILLKGEVPNAQAKQAITDAAKKTHFGKRITNQLTISDEAATPLHELAFPRALAVLDQLDSGSAWWTDGKLEVRGFVAKAKEPTAREIFGASDRNPGLGTINLSLVEDADSCDQEFAKLLSASTIRFATGKAIIAPSSRRLLGKLAELAKRCPGNLSIEGHTDNVGKADANKLLSQRRAGAVLTALAKLGVDSKRLRATGFGQDKPTETNDTATGRAKNRRIELRIAR